MTEAGYAMQAIAQTKNGLSSGHDSGGKVGRPRKHKPRTLWDAIQYLAATGCQWAQFPKDFPPFTTVQYHFYRTRDNGLLDVAEPVACGSRGL